MRTMGVCFDNNRGLCVVQSTEGEAAVVSVPAGPFLSFLSWHTSLTYLGVLVYASTLYLRF